MNISKSDIKQSKVLCRVNYSKSNIFAYIITTILFLAFSAFDLYYYLLPIEVSVYSQSYDFEEKLKLISLVGCIFFLICGTLILIKIPALKKSFICLTELGVYGSGGKFLYFSTQSFVIPYNEITNIKYKSDTIFIEHGGNQYKIIVRKAYEVVQGIKIEISMHKPK